MSRFVVDASVVLTWCFPDENSALAERVAQMFKEGDSAIAPSFWPHELLNALLVGEKRKRISGDLIRAFLTDLATLPIVLQESQADAVFDGIQSLSREHGLTAYDAAYLDLAQTNGLPVATLDEDLMRACARTGVELIRE
ncbi:MAG: type II toxin-antitoxin system VapC family toxin [Candidatus Sulfotelmatobacter sp.]